MKRIFMLLIFLFVWLWQLIAQRLEIHQINVGVGSATLVLAYDPTGALSRAILIDAGNTGPGYDSVTTYLNALGIRHLNAVYATHYDADHIGGFAGTGSSEYPGLLANALAPDPGLTIDSIYDRGTVAEPGSAGVPATATYTRYSSLANNPNLHRTTLTSPRTITLYDQNVGGGTSSITLETIAVNGNVGGTQYTPTSENDRSAALLLRFRNFRFFIGGDLSGDPEYIDPADPEPNPHKSRRTCADELTFGDTEIGSAVSQALGPHTCGSLVTHHGATNCFTGYGGPGSGFNSASSSAAASASAVASNPLTFALISSGRQGRYAHPRQDPLNLLYAAGVFVYITADDLYDRAISFIFPGAANPVPGSGTFNSRNIVVIVQADGTVTVNGVNRNCPSHPR